MAYDGEMSNEELEALREEQSGIADHVMSTPEIKSYLGGFPPGGQAIANPRQAALDYEVEVQTQLDNGVAPDDIEVSWSPLTLIREQLETMFPDLEPALDLAASWGASAPAASPQGVELTNIQPALENNTMENS